MYQGQHEQAVGAGPEADPLVGDGRVAGLHRVHRDELGVAAGLHAPEAGLDGVGIMVLGDAEEHEVAGVVPVRLEIGRASCRERVCQYVSLSGVAGYLKKKLKYTKAKTKKNT